MLSSRKALSVTFFSLILASTPLSVFPQQGHGGHDGQGDQMQHDGGGDSTMQHGSSGGMMHNGDGGMMNNGDSGGMMRRGMRRMQDVMGESDGPGTVGQSAFAVIRDVVNTLQADPDTDWSQVNVEALRQHLIDMDRVTLFADATVNAIEGGARYIVTGNDERTVAAIQRMVPTHALQIERELDWDTSTDRRQDGVELTIVAADREQTAMIRGLGFIGFMVQGEHHADHHLMMAGGNPQAESGNMGGSMNHGGDNH